MKNKKGVSPVIATILLVVLVIIIAIIIFLWFKGMKQEAVTKFDENIALVCDDVQFDADYSGETLYISNTGNVPIYSMDVKIEKGGSHTTSDITKIVNNWPGTGLNQGGVFSGKFKSSPSSGSTIILIPILMGENENSVRTTSACEERHGVEIKV